MFALFAKLSVHCKLDHFGPVMSEFFELLEFKRMLFEGQSILVLESIHFCGVSYMIVE